MLIFGALKGDVPYKISQMAQDNQGLLTHILPGWVFRLFPQQFLDINSAYFGLYRQVYRGNQLNVLHVM